MQHVLYINLKKRTDRKIHADMQFHKMGICAERVDAVECSTGTIGCALSHIKCLELAKSRQWSHVCICEDDILFTNPKRVKNTANFLFEYGTWDVLLLGANIAPPFFKVSECCMRVANAQTTTGYIVKQHYYDTLIRNIKEGISNLLQYPIHKNLYAIDIYWKRLQRKDIWFIITPLSVVQYPDYSDIEQRNVNYVKHMLDDKSFLKCIK